MAPQVAIVHATPKHSDSEDPTQNEVGTGQVVKGGYGEDIEMGSVWSHTEDGGYLSDEKSNNNQEKKDCCPDKTKKNKELESLHIKTDIEPMGGTPPFLPGGIGGWSNIKNFWSILKSARSFFNAAKSGTGVLNQLKSAESLINEAGSLTKVNAGMQGFVKGDGVAIFKAISQGGTQQANGTILMQDGIILFKHISKTTGVYTIDINKAGQIFKIRILP
ncbi:hypothetical protein [Algoriphagus antarcticus]|nr:hypothetical protein [Algoriphagus antarcticus]